MATPRPRTAGLNFGRRQSFRPYYVPFTPKVEERDENEAHILRLELPVFSPQLVTVKVDEETRTVAVTGDQSIPTGNNQLFRLNKTYPVPENCIIDKIEHKFENKVLVITMPKETTGQMAAKEAAAPPPKEPEQPTPEKGKEDISRPVDSAPPEAKAETKRPEEAQPTDDGKGQQSAELQKQASAKAKEETSTQEAVAPKAKEEAPAQEAVAPKAKEEALMQEAVAPKAKEEAPTQEVVEPKAKEEAPMQEVVAPKAKEEAPTQEAVAPKAEKGPEAEKKPTRGESGVSETTQDQKIRPLDRKATVTKKIEDENPEEDAKAKESKTEEDSKNQEKPKVATAAPSQIGIRIPRLAGGFKIGRMPFKLTASLAAAAVMAVVAYFAYAYYYNVLPASE